MDYQKIDSWHKLPELDRLKDLPDAPKHLFFQGTWTKEIFNSCVAVVGSRKMTDYGRQVLEKLIPKLVFANKTIVSGFMYGVDQYAHQLALNSGGKTIAILGWGISEPLSDYDKVLSQKIIQSKGLILSEWENQKGALWTFPRRNRIVAALSSEIYIVEAGAKSGSLITADLGKKLRRKIYAVPGPITSHTSRGTNELIAKGEAQMWLGEALHTVEKTNDPIISILQNERLTTNDIARKLNLGVAEVGTKLSMLILEGKINEHSGKYYI